MYIRVNKNATFFDDCFRIQLKQHGYEFAKLCYQVKKYEDAVRYEHCSVIDVSFKVLYLQQLLKQGVVSRMAL